VDHPLLAPDRVGRAPLVEHLRPNGQVPATQPGSGKATGRGAYADPERSARGAIPGRPCRARQGVGCPGRGGLRDAPAVGKPTPPAEHPFCEAGGAFYSEGGQTASSRGNSSSNSVY
jgi:hypothetical protein